MYNREIKILHIGLSSNMGGIENVVKSWNSKLPENIQFDFVNVENSPIAFQDEFIENGSKIFSVTSRKSNPFKSYKQLERLIKVNEYDYVQHHMMSFSWPDPILIAQRNIKTQAIAHCHTAGSKSMNLKYKALDFLGHKRISRNDYLRIACGDTAGKNMFGGEAFTVIPNGVDFSKCHFSIQNRIKIRKKYNISSNTYVIGHVGRSNPVKNYPFILKLFSELLKTTLDVKLLLIGDVSEDSNIKRLIEFYGIKDKVVLTGVLNDIKEYYSAMDVFILPSFYEGVSVAMIEAQAAGLPCIVSEFVAKDADISNNVSYISIDNVNEGVNIVMSKLREKKNREVIEIDNTFDLENTSKKMFEFYEQHLL